MKMLLEDWPDRLAGATFYVIVGTLVFTCFAFVGMVLSGLFWGW